MYFNLSRKHSDRETLDRMSTVFNHEYPTKGMAFCFGTHSRYPIWLLIGVVRIDEPSQLSLTLLSTIGG